MVLPSKVGQEILGSYSFLLFGFINILKIMLIGALLYVAVCSTLKFGDALSTVQGWLDTFIEYATFVFLGLASWSLVPVVSSMMGPIFASFYSVMGSSTPAVLAATIAPVVPLDPSLVTGGMVAILSVLGCVAGNAHGDK